MTDKKETDLNGQDSSQRWNVICFTKAIEHIVFFSHEIDYSNAIKNGARPMFTPDLMPHSPKVFVVGYQSQVESEQ